MTPWQLELLVVRDGSHGSTERRAMARDVERGLFLRLLRGAYAERAAVAALSVEERHILQMRALAAVSDRPIVFSHFSAAVLHDMPVLWRRLTLPHATFPDASSRKREGVVAFADPRAEDPNESHSRTQMLRIGLEPPELQWELWDAMGFVAFLDFFFRRFRVGGEADGLVKLLDPRMAPRGAAQAVITEKRREDRVLPIVHGLARWGWTESTNTALLRQRLAAFGVHPGPHRATIADYAATARDAVPRQAPRHPQLRA